MFFGKEYKGNWQVIYPIILTHLDPGVFFDFCFNNHKIQIHYLQARSSAKAKNTLKLIQARDEEEYIIGRLEKHWFHFHIDTEEIARSDWPSNLPVEWRESDEFHAYTSEQLGRYLSEKNYDSLAVCFKVRVEIEKQAYNLLKAMEM